MCVCVCVCEYQIGDDTSKLATRYTYQQLQFFKAMVETIALGDDNDGEQMMSAMEAMNLDERKFAMTQAATQAAMQAGGTQSVKAMTVGDKEKTLKALVADRWLGRIERSGGNVFYTIGVRSFLELRKYILDLDLEPELRNRWEAAM